MILLGTGKQIAGKESAVVIGGVALTFSSWQASASSVNLPTINFTSFDSTAYSSDGFTSGQSYDEGIQGVLSAAMSYGGDWDAETNMLDVNAPPGLYPRDDLMTLALEETFATAIGWLFPWSRIRGSQNASTADGKVTFTVSQAMNQGSFTMPVGAG